MASKNISNAVAKALAEKLDEATLNRIVDRVVKDAERGDKEAVSHLLHLLGATSDIGAAW